MKKSKGIVFSSGGTFRCPIILLERYEDKLRKYGFQSKSEILRYLAIEVWKQDKGLKISYPVRNIIKNIEINRHSFLLSLPTTSCRVFFTEDGMAKILTLDRFLNYTNLMNAIIEAFVLSEAKYIYLLRIEMHKRFVYDLPESDMLSATVSDEQYGKLFEIAYRANLTLTELVRITIDTILKTEGFIQDKTNLPFEIEDFLQECLKRQGFTRHLFQRKKQLCFYVNDETRFRQILELIHKYRIPGTNEFLRRVFLFLLDSENIGFRYMPEESEPEDSGYFDDNESYYNERLSRKDFARSIYQ